MRTPTLQCNGKPEKNVIHRERERERERILFGIELERIFTVVLPPKMPRRQPIRYKTRRLAEPFSVRLDAAAYKVRAYIDTYIHGQRKKG